LLLFFERYAHAQKVLFYSVSHEHECFFFIFNINYVVGLCIQCDINLPQQQQHRLKTSSCKRAVILTINVQLFVATTSLSMFKETLRYREVIVFSEMWLTVLVRVLNYNMNALWIKLLHEATYLHALAEFMSPDM